MTVPKAPTIDLAMVSTKALVLRPTAFYGFSGS